jgi:hypothetical protein
MILLNILIDPPEVYNKGESVVVGARKILNPDKNK